MKRIISAAFVWSFTGLMIMISVIFAIALIPFYHKSKLEG